MIATTGTMIWAARHWKPLAAIAATLTVLAAGGLVAALGAVAAVASSQAAQASSPYCMTQMGSQPAFGQWSVAQMTNAAIITATGESRNVPAYGLIIAVATAMQESSLINLPHGTADSAGLFQQRPSQGWGTHAQVMNPVYASRQFFRHLTAIRGWQRLPLTQAAQDVQRSGHPGAYAHWQAPAETVLAHLTSPTSAGSECGTASPTTVSGKLRAVLAYALNARDTLYDYGGSCTDPHSSDMALHCDCSSLVQQSFAQAGLNLPRTAQQQWKWASAGHAQIIPPARAQVGDVIYVPTYLGPNIMGHTGIIINPTRHLMIDAPNIGQPVRVDSYAWAIHVHLFRVVRYLAT